VCESQSFCAFPSIFFSESITLSVWSSSPNSIIQPNWVWVDGWWKFSDFVGAEKGGYRLMSVFEILERGSFLGFGVLVIVPK